MGALVRGYRAVVAAAAWTGLGLQFALTVNRPGAGPHTVLIFFSYFTVLSNLLVAACMSALALTPASPFGRWAARPTVRGAAALYILVTALIYALLLQGLWSPHGAQLIADRLQHDIVPALYLVDWLALSPEQPIRWDAPLRWLVFPTAYGVYTLVHGALTGFYPYPFLSVTKLGYGRALLDLVALACLFALLGAALVAVDRARRSALARIAPSRQNSSRAPAD